MFTHYSTPVFVLSSRPKGEADKEFIFFSKEFGRIEAVGKSMRKIDSKLRGAVVPFSVAQTEFIQGRYYKIITYTELLRDFPGIKKSLVKLKAAYRMKEVANGLIKGEEGDGRIWSLFLSSFRALDRLETEKAKLIYLFFSFRLLSVLGYNPELYNCLECRSKLKPEELCFCAKGGVACGLCSSSLDNKEKTKISVESVKVLREIEKERLTRVARLKLGQDTLYCLEKVLDFYISYI